MKNIYNKIRPLGEQAEAMIYKWKAKRWEAGKQRQE